MNAVFIGGCGRSGTTMLGDLLGVHPGHICTPETSFKLGLVERWAWGQPGADVDAALDWVAAHRKFKELGIPVDADLRARVRDKDLRGTLEVLIDIYRRAVDKPSANVWIDHTPTNTRMGVALLEAFPDARIIHVVRDGRAVAASVIPLDWGPNDVLTAARNWVDALAHGFALEQGRPDRVMRVRYEDLVREPAVWLPRICSFAQIEYRPEMLKGGGLRVPASIAHQHALVGKPPDPSRLESWKKSLAPREIEVFEAEAGELLPLLGYAPVAGTAPKPATTLDEIYYTVRDRLLGSSLNRWRKRQRRDKAGYRPRAS